MGGQAWTRCRYEYWKRISTFILRDRREESRVTHESLSKGIEATIGLRALPNAKQKGGKKKLWEKIGFNSLSNHSSQLVIPTEEKRGKKKKR